MPSSSAATNSCDVFFLGAGKPAAGNKPAALKEIGLNTRALDWQLHCLTSLSQPKIHFLGGYHVEDIIASYPHLHYTVIPDWQTHSVIHTLLAAPLHATTTFVLYADTVFRPQILEQVQATTADVVIVYDANWRDRYENRDKNDIAHAEVLRLDQNKIVNNTHDPQWVEFTGLIKFSPKVTEYLTSLDEHQIGRSLLDLILHLDKQDFNIATIDAHGAWAEFNSPADIAHFILGTKAETLSRLAPLVKHSVIGKQVCFTVNEWTTSPEVIMQNIMEVFPNTALVVRSSAKSEDSWQQSHAGGHTSLLNIDSTSRIAMTDAINQVALSYKQNTDSYDQILIQELLAHVSCAGVVFTRSLETGAPYYRINLDDLSCSTESVTAGSSNNLRTVLVNRSSLNQAGKIDQKLNNILTAINELETLLGYDRLDVEFAIDEKTSYIFFKCVRSQLITVNMKLMTLRFFLRLTVV